MCVNQLAARILLGVVAIAGVLVFDAVAAGAVDNDGRAGGSSGSSGPGVVVSTGSGSGGGGSSSGPRSGGSDIRCTYYDLSDSSTSFGSVHEGPLVEGTVMIRQCWDSTGLRTTETVTIGPGGGGGPGIAPETLGQMAFAQVPLPLPEPAVSPAAGAIVNVPVFLWVTNFEGASRSASVPGLSATARTVPQGTRWEIRSPDGSTEVVSCGAGTPWTPGVSSTDCGFVARQPGTYQVTVTLSWSASWSASNGQSGALGTYSRSATFGVTSREIDTRITN